MKKILILTFLLPIIFYVSCESLKHIKTSMSSNKKDLGSIVNNKMPDIFAMNKCWWINNNNLDNINGKSFKQCAIRVNKSEFPETNQFEIPEKILLENLKKKCDEFHGNHRLIDYFWSKKTLDLDIGISVNEKYKLHGLCLQVAY